MRVSTPKLSVLLSPKENILAAGSFNYLQVSALFKTQYSAFPKRNRDMLNLRLLHGINPRQNHKVPSYLPRQEKKLQEEEEFVIFSLVKTVDIQSQLIYTLVQRNTSIALVNLYCAQTSAIFTLWSFYKMSRKHKQTVQIKSTNHISSIVYLKTFLLHFSVVKKKWRRRLATTSFTKDQCLKVFQNTARYSQSLEETHGE